MFPWRMFGEVRGRSDGSHSHLGSDRYGDHVSVHDFAELNARIEAISDDVAQTVAHIEFDIDVGIFGKYGYLLWPDHRAQHLIRTGTCDLLGCRMAWKSKVSPCSSLTSICALTYQRSDTGKT